MTTPTNAQLNQALAMIDQTGWGNCCSVFAIVRKWTVDMPDQRFDGFCQLSARRLSMELWRTEKRHRLAERYLKKLVESKVLLFHESKGSRGHLYRINPDFAAWKVTWRCERRSALDELEAVFVREMSARYGISADRQRSARPNLVPTPGSRHKSSASNLVPTPGSRQKVSPSADPWKSAQISPVPLEVVTSREDFSVVNENSSKREIPEEIKKLSRAIGQRVGAPAGYLYGPPLAMLAELVEEQGVPVNWFYERFEAIPAECRYESVVHWFVDQWESRGLAVAGVAEVNTRVTIMNNKNAELTQLQACENVGDEDGADMHRARIEELDKQLAGLDILPTGAENEQRREA